MSRVGSEERVDAVPRLWPYDEPFGEASVAFCLIDFQHDFCSAGGMADRRGYAITRIRPALEVARNVLDAARAAGLTVIHTRVGRPAALVPPDLDRPDGPVVGGRGPLGRHLVRGEAGHEIVEALAPTPSELSHRQDW